MNRGARGTPQRYDPPTDVETRHLADLLGGARELGLKQQARLGFDDDTKRGPIVWVAGRQELTKRPCVAIVGTRGVSHQGASRARRLARELASAGVVVVSGLAEGVDTEALNAAIAAGGDVIAVIGTPLARAFPTSNGQLQETIYRNHLLVSQFAPGSIVHRSNFPQRNKLMAALSDATVIIEASDTSGTLHQAAECVRLGRWLFVARAVAEDPGLKWPASFLKEPCARVLAQTSDILHVLK